MSNYIIKKVTIKKAKVNYQEKEGYNFLPKSKKYENVAKVTVLDNNLIKQIIHKKVDNDYKKIVSQIYTLLNSSDEADDTANVLAAYTELDRLKQIFLYKYHQKVEKKLLEMYLKKLNILEMEINKIMINMFNYEKEFKGVKR